MSGDREPQVSVVVAAWMAEAFIGGAVASALAQQDVSLEVIVVDDASTDGTADAVRKLGDPRIRLIRQQRNGGPGAARNRGFAEARGRWIAVLDADDRMAPDRLARLAAAGQAAGADAVIDDLLAVSEGGAAIGPLFGPALVGVQRLDLPQFMLSNRVFARGPNLGYAKPLFRTGFLRRHGLGYDPSLQVGEDYMLLADCLAAGAGVAVVPAPLYRYTRRRGSTSHRLDLARIEEMRRADRAFARRWRLEPAAAAALRRRARALDDAAAFTRAVSAIKARDPVAVASALWRRPRAALIFRYPLGARLGRVLGRRGEAAP